MNEHPVLLFRFCCISMLMQIKTSMSTIKCLSNPNDSTEDMLDFLTEQLSDMDWLTSKFPFTDKSDSLSERERQSLEDALSAYVSGVDLPWTFDGLDLTPTTLKQILSALPVPESKCYISGTAVYRDNMQASSFGSLYGDKVERMASFLKLGSEYHQLEKELLEISSFQAALLVNLSLNDHPYTFDEWFVCTLDTTEKPVFIDTVASYRNDGDS